jgi:hypothetical protein
MAVAFGAAGTLAAQTTGTTITPALPAGLAVGNLIISVAAVKNNSTLTWPAGWTKVNQTNSGASWTVAWAWRINITGVTAPAITIGTSAAATAQCWSYTGQDQFNPIGALGTVTALATSPHTSTAISTTRANSFAIYIDACSANTVLTAPSGYTQNVGNGSATSVTANAAGSKTVATQGTSTGAISTTGGAAAYTQQQIEILAPMPAGSIEQGAGRLDPHLLSRDPSWRLDRTWIQAPFTPPNMMPGAADWPLIDRPAWLQPHQQYPNLTTTTLLLPIGPLGVVFNQYDWPAPRGPLRAADLLTWIASVNLALTATPPFTQYDWPAPARLTWDRTWTWRHVHMLGQDQLPAGAQVFDLPMRAPKPIEQTTMWRHTIMLGQDKLPAGAQVAELARAPARPDSTWILPTNLPLFAPPAVGPLGVVCNQYDWPLPIAAPRPDGTYVFGLNPNLPPPPPPAIGPAVYNKPMLAGPAYLNVIPGEKPS